MIQSIYNILFVCTPYIVILHTSIILITNKIVTDIFIQDLIANYND